MKKLFALLAVVGTLLVAGFTGATAAAPAASNVGAIAYNVDPGGGSPTSFFYYSRVYTFYDGYWHWLNCEWVIYSDGSAILNRCW
jgi:hypothetical protein